MGWRGLPLLMKVLSTSGWRAFGLPWCARLGCVYSRLCHFPL